MYRLEIYSDDLKYLRRKRDADTDYRIEEQHLFNAETGEEIED